MFFSKALLILRFMALTTVYMMPFIAALLIFSPKILFAEFMQSNTFHTRILRGKN